MKNPIKPTTATKSVGNIKVQTSIQRLERIAELIGDGYLPYQVIHMCCTEWNVRKPVVTRYLQLVNLFLSMNVNSIDKDKILIQYNQLALKYERKGDARMALEYRKQRDKLMGLEKQIVEVNQTIIEVKRNSK